MHNEITYFIVKINEGFSITWLLLGKSQFKELFYI
jgi:hypothetical protein